ncbi:unnamed protein product [Heterobilharzia americana]|nr:unnamed protein product [Heterobilharzia americana]
MEKLTTGFDLISRDDEEQLTYSHKKNNSHSTGLTTLSFTNEINPELLPPVLTVTSPTDSKPYSIDLSCNTHKIEAKDEEDMTTRKRYQLSVDLGCSSYDTGSKLRRYSDQGGTRISPMNSHLSLSSPYKRRSLYNITTNSHNHDYYKTKLYPPTRTKNTSSSNVDLLAEAILQMHGTLKFPENDLIPKSKIDCRRSTLGCSAVNCFPIKLTNTPKKLFVHEDTEVYKLADNQKQLSTSSNQNGLLSTTTTTTTTTTATLNSRRNSEFIKNNHEWKLFTPNEGSLMKSSYKNASIHFGNDEEKIKSFEGYKHQSNENHFIKCHPMKLDISSTNHGISRLTENQLNKSPESLNTISLHVPKLPLIKSSLSNDGELSQRIRRVSMMLQNRQDSTTQSASQRSDSVDYNFPKLIDSKCSMIPLKKNMKDDILKVRTISQDTDSYSDSPVKVNKTFDHGHLNPLEDNLIINKEIQKNDYKIRNNFNDKNILLKNKYKRERRLTEKLSKGIGYHLGRRRRLLESRRRMADFALAFSIFGIIAAFLDIEFISRSLYHKNSIYSMIMRILISFSTVILLLLIISYHTYDIMVFLCEEYTKDWRICVTKYRVIQIVTELFICSIHPFPGIDLFYDRQFPVTNFINYKRNHPLHHLDDHFSPYLLLILPMLGRLYLALRALLLHSRMFNDAGSRSIGAMNKVSFDLQFVLKTLMTLCPAKALLIFITTIWIIFSWTLRACELEQGENHLSLLNSAWLISVTFLSIGYGDIVPHTSCGRLIAVATGLMGSACTALLVAVFSRKLEMTKAEKHVLHFMESSKLSKKVKHCAANVLRETWLLYKHAKLMPTFNSRRVRTHQRKFLQAIYRLRTMKVRQRELQDKSNSLVDLAKLQTNVYERVAEISLHQEDFQNQLTNIEEMLKNVQI